jgi:hypothetical protein
MSNPLAQHLVPFYGDELIAVQQPDGTIFVLFARLRQNLGLGRESQVRRINRHSVLSQGLITQAAEVSNRVKALAELLTGKDASKNHYQGIFGELYRRYGVSSYKTIRLEQYEAVLTFLEDWRKSIGIA